MNKGQRLDALQGGQGLIPNRWDQDPKKLRVVIEINAPDEEYSRPVKPYRSSDKLRVYTALHIFLVCCNILGIY